MAKTTETKIKNDEQKNSMLDILRFGESYTSLILGIAVVIIATVLLLSFVRNKNITGRDNLNQHSVTQKTQTQKTEEKKMAQNVPTLEQKASPTPTPQVKKESTTTTTKGSNYTVERGDTLWSIAEAKYKSGYNWVDIAKANNLTSPNLIHAGNQITIPSVEPKLATATTVTTVAQKQATKVTTATQANNIIGDTYTIVKGDNLWTIAVRAYGDGYQWVKVAQANNLTTNPGLIHSGNKLKIPRG